MLTRLKMSQEQTEWQDRWQIEHPVRYHVWHYLLAEEKHQVCECIQFSCYNQLQQRILDSMITWFTDSPLD